MKALIDGDSLVYTLGFACEQKVHQAQTADGTPIVEHLEKDVVLKWIETNGHEYPGVQLGFRINVSPPEHAYHSVKIVIQKIAAAAKANSYIVYLTGGGNFREGIATIMGYKHNRKARPKPALYEHIRWYLQTHHGAKMIEGMEADDALSMVYTRSKSGEPVKVGEKPDGSPLMKFPEECIICAIDKDLRTVAGKQVNFSNKVAESDGRYKTVIVSDEDARRNFYTQLLTGDTSDNILGVPKIGPGKAEKILADCHSDLEMFDAVWATYKAHYGTKWFEYFHYDAYTDTTQGYTKRELKPEAEILPEQRIQGHALTMLLENARLLYMLRSPVSVDGSHWWMPPRSFDELMAEPEQAEAGGEPLDTDIPWLEVDGITIMMSDLKKPSKPFNKGRGVWFVYLKELDKVFGPFASQAKANKAMNGEETLIGYNPGTVTQKVNTNAADVTNTEEQGELPLESEVVTTDDLVVEPKDSSPEVATQKTQGGDEGEGSALPKMTDPDEPLERIRHVHENEPAWWSEPWWKRDFSHEG